MANGTIASLMVRIGGDISDLEKALSKASRKMQDAGKQMSEMGKTLTTRVTAPLVGFGALALRTAGNFESSMNRVAAISQATGQELEQLENVARQLGATTQFSASQAADAMSFLAMAGFEVNEVTQAMPSVLNLAAAAQLDMASAADIASNIMSGFNMTANELEGAVDILAKSFTSANTDLSQLGEAMKMVGPVAAGFGIAFEESAAAVGFLSDAGIQASSAGTGLRRILSTLAQNADELGVSVWDAQGNMRPLADIIEQIEEVGLSSARAMEIFGDRGGPAMQVLLSRGSSALREMTGELGDAGGTAQRIADQQMQGLNGALKQLRSAFEELQIAIAKSGLLDFATNLIQRVTSLVQRIGSLNPETLKFGTIIAGVAAAIGPLLVVGGKLVTVLGALTSPIGLVVAGIAGLIVIGKNLYDNWELIAAELTNLWDGIKVAAWTIVAGISEAFGWMADGILGTLSSMAAALQPSLVGPLEFARSQIEAATDAINEKLEESKDQFDRSGEAAVEARDNMTSLSDSFWSITDAIQNGIGAGLGWLSDTIFPKVTEETDKLTIATRKLGNALNIPQGELKKVEGNTDSVAVALGKTKEQAEIMGEALQSTVSSAITSFGETLGNVFTGDAGASGFFNNILLVVADFGKQLGRMLIAAGVAAQSFQALLANPVAAIVAGGALIAASTAVSNLLKKGPETPELAQGGLAFGPTLAVVGDNRNVRSDPEVIAPLSKLQGMMGDSRKVEVFGQIRGEDIFISSERGGKTYNR